MERKKKPLVRALQIALSVGLTLAIFVFIIPKIAGYMAVWQALGMLTPLEIVSIVAAMIFSLFTYWWQLMAAMPGLTLGQSAVNNQCSTTVANVMPGGGIVSMGVSYAMFHSWGFTRSQIALLISTTGIWNTFLKLFLPVFALVLLAFTGKASIALLVPAMIGLGILIVIVTIFTLALAKKRAAHVMGMWVGAVLSRIRRVFRRPPVEDWGQKAVRFRTQTVALVGKRWPELTITTIVSHLALYLVLLLALRQVGVSEAEVGWIQVLAVFAFARLLSAAPITPGGIGVVELALIGGLYAAGSAHADVPLATFKAQITAAALLFRVLTFGLQIPLGGFAYIVWQRRKTWRKPQPAPALELELARVAS